MSFAALLIRAALIRTLAVIYSIYAIYLLFKKWLQIKGNLFQSQPHLRPHVLDGWTHSFVDCGSIRLHYVETGSPNAPLMLCIHGFPEFWYSWRYQLKHFSDKYRVVALDLRGYGDSDKPEGVENYNLNEIVHDVELFIEALGYKKAVVLAHDWGGATAQRLALKRPELFDRLVVMNVPHPKVFTELFKKSEQRKKSWYFFMFLCPGLPEFFMRANDFENLEAIFRSKETGFCNSEAFTDEDLEAWKYTYGKPGALSPPMNYNRATMLQFRPAEFPKPILQPKTLYIWGQRDGFLMNEGGDLSIALCKNARLVKIPNASHWVQQDAHEDVNKHIEEFLAERSS
uniref:AB hydrolase-1 domain-containing protein n=1 Tax=Panagrolaimus sp. ES5 TaxID=591445 RepID=A0AC34FZS3_9BILA